MVSSFQRLTPKIQMQVVDVGGGKKIEKKDPVACKEHKTLLVGSHAEPYQSYRIKTAITKCFLKVNLSSSILYFSSWVFL